jgi:hypothetical protein
MKNVIYLKEHQQQLVQLETEALAKAVMQKINDRWLVAEHDTESRDLALSLLIQELQKLTQND